MDRKGISAVILTKDEEDKIKDRINELKFCNEIIIIDDNSCDKTENISKELGAKVYKYSKLSFSERRNYGLKKAKNNWVLFVDADEEISNELESEVLKAVENNKYSGYYLKRKDYFLGRQLRGGEQADNKFLRLGKKGKGKWVRDVHETWKIDGNLGILKSPIIHNQTRSLNEHIEKLNYYSSLHAKGNYDEGKRSAIFKIFFYPVFKFFDNFILKKGFIDKEYGFLAAMLMSLHSFLSWAKLWILQKN